MQGGVVHLYLTIAQTHRKDWYLLLVSFRSDRVGKVVHRCRERVDSLGHVEQGGLPLSHLAENHLQCGCRPLRWWKLSGRRGTRHKRAWVHWRRQLRCTTRNPLRIAVPRRRRTANRLVGWGVVLLRVGVVATVALGSGTWRVQCVLRGLVGK